MEEKVLKRLYDIKSSIDEIESYFKNSSIDFEKYSSDVLLKRAVERNLEIIGETVNRIIKGKPNFPIDDARKIVGLRNQIIHAYDNISDENIWAVLKKHIPKLKNQIIQIAGW